MTRLAEIPEVRSFIRHWGEMGSAWGVNRSVAQVHALLYLSEPPLPADEICEELRLARSNVSNALRELQAYGIVRRVHLDDDRRDHFLAETDVWELFTRIVAERKRREIDPTIALMQQLADSLAVRPNAPAHVRDRIGAMQSVLGMLGEWHADVSRLPRRTLLALVRLGARVARIVPGPRINP